MNAQLIGAAMIVVSCGSFGFSIAARKRQEERMLRTLRHFLSYTLWELQYKLTPLAELIRHGAKDTHGTLRKTLLAFSDNLDNQNLPDAGCCMELALSEGRELPASVRECLLFLGQSLGRFDLPGQIHGLEAVRSQCTVCLTDLSQGAEERLRSYRILGLCTGISLAVLLV